MRKNIFLFIIMAVMAGLCNFVQAKVIYLHTGQKHIWPADNVQKVRVEKGQVLGVQQIGPNLHIRARAPGKSKLYIDSTQHQFIVLPGATLSSFDRLKNQINKIPSLNLKIVGTEAHIYGQLRNFKHWQQLANLNAPYQFKAQIHPRVRLQSQLFFSELLRKHSLAMPLIKWHPRVQVQLGGKSKLPVKRIQNLLSPYGLTVQHEPDALFIEPTVRLQVVLAEVNKKWSRTWGLQWASNTVAQLLQTPSTMSVVELLNTMESQGKGEILAQPTLLCRNKGEAKFLAGGEFGIQIKTANTTKVVWKPHGVMLKLKPQLGPHNRMKLDVNVEVSMIDHSQKVPSDLPALKTNRFSSQFDLLQSQTVYLSGLMQNMQGQSLQGLSYLTRIPILGALFGSREYTRNNTSLVVFVTPHKVQN